MPYELPPMELSYTFEHRGMEVFVSPSKPLTIDRILQEASEMGGYTQEQFTATLAERLNARVTTQGEHHGVRVYAAADAPQRASLRSIG